MKESEDDDHTICRGHKLKLCRGEIIDDSCDLTSRTLEAMLAAVGDSDADTKKVRICEASQLLAKIHQYLSRRDVAYWPVATLCGAATACRKLEE